MLKFLLYWLFPFFILGSCTNSETKKNTPNTSIEYIDMVVIKNDQLVDNTLIGGLSSIDYLKNNEFVVISDDRSEYSDARIYEISIDFDDNGIHGYNFKKTTFLKNQKGKTFQKNELDPESIRYNSNSDTYFYTSEGGRGDEWINPFVWQINKEGEFLSEINTPELFNFNEDKGIRDNGGFESLTFENDSIIWYANELPLKEDGEVPGFEKGKYPIRLVRHDFKNDVILNQFVYNISPLKARPIPKDGFYINSVPEILFIEKGKLWVMERSYTTGVGNFVKVFEIETEEATDVKANETLAETEYTSVSKKLIIDFSDYNQKIDNIEGMAFGPDFKDGSKSLVFISDDNFNDEQESQIWLFSFNKN